MFERVILRRFVMSRAQNVHNTAANTHILYRYQTGIACTVSSPNCLNVTDVVLSTVLAFSVIRTVMSEGGVVMPTRVAVK